MEVGGRGGGLAPPPRPFSPVCWLAALVARRGGGVCVSPLSGGGGALRRFRPASSVELGLGALATCAVTAGTGQEVGGFFFVLGPVGRAGPCRDLPRPPRWARTSCWKRSVMALLASTLMVWAVGQLCVGGWEDECGGVFASSPGDWPKQVGAAMSACPELAEPAALR